jgi:hypothetical protein
MPKTLMVSKAFLAVERPRTQWWVTSVSCPVAKAGISPVGGKRFPRIEFIWVYNNPQKRIEKAHPSKLVKNLKLFHFFVCFIYPAHDHFGQGKSSATPWQKKMKNGFSMFQYVSVHAKNCRFPPSGDLLGYVPTDASFQCMSGLKGKRMVKETVKPYFTVKKTPKRGLEEVFGSIDLNWLFHVLFRLEISVTGAGLAKVLSFRDMHYFQWKASP